MIDSSLGDEKRDKVLSCLYLHMIVLRLTRIPDAVVVLIVLVGV